jgi:hypothetical protein
VSGCHRRDRPIYPENASVPGHSGRCGADSAKVRLLKAKTSLQKMTAIPLTDDEWRPSTMGSSRSTSC